LFTHFADAAASDFTHLQLERFLTLRGELERAGICFELSHCANSLAMLHYPEMHMDMVRPGIVLYGQMPDASVENTWDLRPVMSLHSIVSQVKNIEAGTAVSYSRSYIAETPRKIAVIPIGYADGYSRLLSNRGKVLVKGRTAGIAGRVCMDMTVIDITGINGVEEGTPVVLFGCQDGVTLSVEALAEQTGTIGYELLCNIGKRVPRVYRRGGREIGVQDMVAEQG
jgi:alanine racemase